MPREFKDAAELITNELFKRRVQIAVAKVAAQVIAEKPTIVYHTMRANWAAKVISDIVTYTRNAMFVICSHPAIVEGCEDKVLERILYVHVNQLAWVEQPNPESTATSFQSPLGPQPVVIGPQPVVPPQRTLTDKILGRNKESK